MTCVAWYINDMKRRHEHAVRLQEIQSLLINWKGPDLTIYGELVLEGTFRVHRVRNEKTFFLFDKALLITKKRGDHFVYKGHIPCSSLMLIESTRDSLCFTVTHYKHSKQQYSIQAKTVEEKRNWTHHIKRLILENHHTTIPQKAKEAILEMDSYYPNRYRYSPERLKKAWSSQDEVSTHVRQGRRQSGKSGLFVGPSTRQGTVCSSIRSRSPSLEILGKSRKGVCGASSPCAALYQAPLGPSCPPGLGSPPFPRPSEFLFTPALAALLSSPATETSFLHYLEY